MMNYVLWGKATPYVHTKPLIVRVKPSFYEQQKDDKNLDFTKPLKSHDVTDKEIDSVFTNKKLSNITLYQYLFDIFPDVNPFLLKWKPLWIAKVTKKKAKDGVVEFRITYTKDVKTYKQNEEIKPFEFLEGMNYHFYNAFHKHFFSGDKVIVRKTDKKRQTKAIYVGIQDISQIQVLQS